MIRVLWLVLAALVAGVVAAWTYGRREEPVPARAGPAALRGLALFFLVAGLALPALRDGAVGADGPVVLLDISRSMGLPATAGGVPPTDPTEAVSRMDSARSVLGSLGAGRVLLFGDEPLEVTADSAVRAAPSAARSRLVPALEAARLSGAEGVLVVSDGEWDDRPLVRETARRLGLGVREIRVAAPVRRVGLAELAAPPRARAGDTARIDVRLVATGANASAESVRVELRTADRVVGRAAASVPASGRSERLQLAFVPRPTSSGEVEWRSYEVRLSRGADPLQAADRRRFQVEVSEIPGGGVLVSADPDWEPRFLLPRLERAVLGGAVGYLHLGSDRWVEMGRRPRPASSEEVRRAVGRARLLAVQGRGTSFPPWLGRAAERHPRRLLFPRGRGDVPGTPLAMAGPLPGEWYAGGPLPPSPVAAYLAGIPLEALPPLAVLYRAEGVGAPGPGAGVAGLGSGPDAWTPLVGRRSGRGQPRPLVVAGRAATGRWAVAAGEGYWRWAARGAAPRRAYEGLVTGLVGWLLEGPAPRQVELEESSADRPLRWRVAAGVRDLRLVVRDSAGAELWSSRFEEPRPEVQGPSLAPGRYTTVAEGRHEDGSFRRERPVELAADPREMLPRAVDAPIAIAARVEERGPAARRPRAAWPFALAAILLCGEWIWRRRIGLR